MTETLESRSIQQEEILTRLRRVEGQIRGIQRMIEEGRECEAIVTQLMAARAALDRAGLFIMTHHISSCLAAAGRNDPSQLNRIIEFFIKFAGPLPEELRPASDAGAELEEPA